MSFLVNSYRFGGSSWTPAEISTALWLDAADSSTITTVDGSVSEWRDKSGNNRHVSQLSGALRPSYSEAGLNSKPAILFDGINDHLTHTGYLELQGLTGFVVGRLNSNNTSANQGVFTMAGDGALDWQSGGAIVWNSGAFNFFTPSGADARYSGEIPSLSNRSLPFDTTYVYCFRTSSGIHINGSLLFSGSATSTLLKITRIAVGARVSSNSFSNHPNVDISEIVLFDNPISNDLLDKTFGYLAHKWGLTQNLPSNHPYKIYPPR